MHVLKHGPHPPGVQFATKLVEKDLRDAIASVAAYIHEQRERFLFDSQWLSKEQKATMAPYFSPALLDATRKVELVGWRLDNPPFYPQAKARGCSNLPDIRHIASLTFNDVVVFQEPPTDRTLFHGLVHAVQFQMLGLDRFAELFVRGFLRMNSHFLVPLETHAFSLDSRFAANPELTFSVEDDVLGWIKEGRYSVS